ncbi:hypothetical protein [Hymenobacter norwichensis]|uniref:hypothetical protein n=1 Tax=Hymenobacter norwichensis TaxID=223903 RepID=UPI0003B76D5E|nr:hypothetical protein [Hymenobacter norwichensis]
MLKADTTKPVTRRLFLGAALQRQLIGQDAALDLVLLPLLANIDNEQDLAKALRQPLARTVHSATLLEQAAHPLPGWYGHF